MTINRNSLVYVTAEAIARENKVNKWEQNFYMMFKNEAFSKGNTKIAFVVIAVINV